MSENSLGTKTNKPLIEVDDLVKHYPVRGGVFQRATAWIKAVDGITFDIKEGETLGLVGESGCGKTTVGQTMLRLLEPTDGKVCFQGMDISQLSGQDLKELRKDMQIIFQDPTSSLDPRMTIGDTVGEGLRIHRIGTSEERHETIIRMLKKVGLEDYHMNRYPHEFSGGQRQRIGIARALVLQPRFIVADEPVSALDVSIQSQVLNILNDLQNEFNLTYLFIAHNMSVIEHISDRVAVMYLGKIVELAPRDEMYDNPLHPYSQALMSAIPIPNPNIRRKRIVLSGDVPSPLNPPSGCRFHPRCPVVMDHCSRHAPKLIEVTPEHHTACWRIE
jgi:peptide/nickel transport system ATP-binding protein/oligopeptide transport system ATP-binding protein